MYTLIINGSPRPDGDLAALLAAFKSSLRGDFVQVDAYREKVTPCLDCRRCRETGVCPVADGMGRIIELADGSGAILIASPVYFSSLTPPLAAIGSRLQSRYYASLRGEKPAEKRGAVLLAAGGNGAPDGAYRMARAFLRLWGVRGDIPLAGAWQTDRIPAGEDREALRQAKMLAGYAEGFSSPSSFSQST